MPQKPEELEDKYVLVYGICHVTPELHAEAESSSSKGIGR